MKIPSSKDDIRWSWTSSEDASPPRPLTPQNSPNSSSKQRSTEIHFSQQPNSDYDRIRQSIPPQNVDNRQVTTVMFVHEMLQTHNRYRALHQAPPLMLDRNLTEGAQHWAEVIASREKLDPDMDVKNAHIGENLAMKFNSERTDFSGGQFSDYWYSGIADYDFVKKAPRLHQGSGALSFAQMIWKASRMVGFGRAVSHRGRVYVVGRYFPGGNSVEGFTENVLPALSNGIRSEEQQRPSFKMASLKSAGSRMSEYTDPLGSNSRYDEPSPVSQSIRQSSMRRPSDPRGSINKLGGSSAIGAMNENDTLISTSKSTEYQNDRTVVIFEEKYRTPDGATYTRQKKTTYYGEQRHLD